MSTVEQKHHNSIFLDKHFSSQMERNVRLEVKACLLKKRPNYRYKTIFMDLNGQKSENFGFIYAKKGFSFAFSFPFSLIFIAFLSPRWERWQDGKKEKFWLLHNIYTIHNLLDDMSARSNFYLAMQFIIRMHVEVSWSNRQMLLSLVFFFSWNLSIWSFY